VPGLGQVALDGWRELPLGFGQDRFYLTEREAELAQPDDPVEPGDVGTVVQAVPAG
jgi:hypothetical protein